MSTLQLTNLAAYCVQIGVLVVVAGGGLSVATAAAPTDAGLLAVPAASLSAAPVSPALADTDRSAPPASGLEFSSHRRPVC